MELGFHCVLLWVKELQVQKGVLVVPSFANGPRTGAEASEQHCIPQDGMNWIQLALQGDVVYRNGCLNPRWH